MATKKPESRQLTAGEIRDAIARHEQQRDIASHELDVLRKRLDLAQAQEAIGHPGEQVADLQKSIIAAEEKVQHATGECERLYPLIPIAKYRELHESAEEAKRASTQAVDDLAAAKTRVEQAEREYTAAGVAYREMYHVFQPRAAAQARYALEALAAHVQQHRETLELAGVIEPEFDSSAVA